MKKTSEKKLGSISLYDDITEYTEKEKEKIDDYNKILAYQDWYEKDLSKVYNGKIDLQGQRIDSNGVVYEKLVNIEIFATNTINNIFGLGLEKIENKKSVNKYIYKDNDNKKSKIGLTDDGVLVSEFSKQAEQWPLEYVNRAYLRNQKEFLQKAQAEIEYLEGLNRKNKNIKQKRKIQSVRKDILDRYILA